MQTKSALTTGLIYGGASAALTFVVMATVVLIIGQSWDVILIGPGMNAAFFGVLGFIIGFSGHRQTSVALDDVSAQERPSLLKRLGYRFVVGLLISFVASHVALVFFIAVLWAYFGSFEGFEKQKRNLNEVQLDFVAIVAMIGGGNRHDGGPFSGRVGRPVSP
jgi:hypothetical protein